MSITAKFQINSDKVIIEIPHKNLYLEKPNTIIYDSQTNCPVNVGNYCDEIEKDVVERENNIPENLCFAASFQYDDETAGCFDIQVIQHYLQLIYYANQPLPIAIETVDFDFQIENYKLWSEKRQLKFEYDLQTELRARHIRINNVDKGTSIWKRRAEKTLRLLLLNAIPLGVLFYFYPKLIAEFDLLNFLILLLGVGLLFVVNIAIWVFLTEQLLPASYNQFIFESLHSGTFTQKIVNFILSSQRKSKVS